MDGSILGIFAAGIPVPLWFVLIVIVPGAFIANRLRTRSDVTKKQEFERLARETSEGDSNDS